MQRLQKSPIRLAGLLHNQPAPVFVTSSVSLIDVKPHSAKGRAAHAAPRFGDWYSLPGVELCSEVKLRLPGGQHLITLQLQTRILVEVLLGLVAFLHLLAKVVARWYVFIHVRANADYNGVERNTSFSPKGVA